jgi:hypothetical protein
LNSNNFTGISNLGLLEDENSSLKNSIKMGSDIEKQAVFMNTELDDQKNFLDKTRNKLNNMYQRLDVSNSITQFLVRRGRGDTYLCIFLGILTVIILFYANYYLKPMIRGQKE